MKYETTLVEHHKQMGVYCILLAISWGSSAFMYWVH